MNGWHVCLSSAAISRSTCVLTSTLYLRNRHSVVVLMLLQLISIALKGVTWQGGSQSGKVHRTSVKTALVDLVTILTII